MKRNIEILAPAGSYESMRAAMNAGCDAVYMGGSRFGARAYADNPNEDVLIRAIEEAHLRNKKLYLTVNTLVKEEERQSLLYDYLEKYYLAGLDAVIVQDVGVMHFIHRHFPKLPIHASTQTTITMGQGANLLKRMGVTRLVTARELSLKEIKSIRENSDMEIETFVHGALCYCYSGQCLISSMIGGRSGNRGRCAQPCRMSYKFISGEHTLSSKKESYLLSPKDINTVSQIPDLIEAGINSFKIEGRMKKPEYAAGVSYIYRKYVDLYLSEGKESFNEHLRGNEYKADMIGLMDLYNRGGFSEGYGKTYRGKSMMSMVRPNHSGVPVGEIIATEKGQVKIKFVEDINAQDILEIRNKENEPEYEFTIKDDRPKGDIFMARVGQTPFKNNNDNKTYNSARLGIGIHDMVYRTRNNALLGSIRERFIDKDIKQEISGYLYVKQGERLQLTLSYNSISVTAYHKMVEAAIKQPMTKERLYASINKLGDTIFQFEELTIEADSNIFVPVAWLNELRREAVNMLSEAIVGSYHRNKEDIDTDIDTSISNVENTKACNIGVGIQTEEQFELAVESSGVASIYVDYDRFNLQNIIEMSQSSSKTNKLFYIQLPHICRESVYEKLHKDIFKLIEHDSIDGFIVKNFEEVALLQSVFKSTGRIKKIRLNHNMYIFNKEAKLFWRENEVHEFTAPIELNQKELRELDLYDCELMVYGYLPVMVSVQCLYNNTKGCNKCEMGTGSMDYLEDKIGKRFYVWSNCNNCYSIIYNGQRLSLLGQADKIRELKPNGIRLDFIYETPEEMKTILSAYIDVFLKYKQATLEFDNITTGHFKRGVE